MQIRDATAADAAAIARVHVATWQAAYRGQIPEIILKSLDVEKRIVRWQEILSQQNGITPVAEVECGIIGFSSLVSSRDSGVDARRTAEIAALYVLPRHWRQGVGSLLCARTFSEAKERGFYTITLWVLKSNLPAIRFYESLGFIQDGATRADRIKDFTLDEIRLARAL
jgi:ribosomal protein S18 acetylase RimI-like enzyme